MKYTLEKKSRKFSILKLSDRVTIYQLQEFRQVFEEVKRRLGGEKNLIIDFNNLLYMDPLALGVIVAFSKEFREKGGELKIINTNGDLGLIFEMSRLSKVYEIFKNSEEAEKSFG